METILPAERLAETCSGKYKAYNNPRMQYQLQGLTSKEVSMLNDKEAI
ncbi:hypothetical protein COLO4_30197 [Corchorus olitorius]|uniref:Uncharacterized protein n=1 Tax=Corchorus olitorius TaxID=93759 RepID=A0A1R3HA94_9ROSI|nr:hypothetical protein COLO4_30197 [Corchorus olitorius]